MEQQLTRCCSSFRGFAPPPDSQSCAAFVHLLRKLLHKTHTTLSAAEHGVGMIPKVNKRHKKIYPLFQSMSIQSKRVNAPDEASNTRRLHCWYSWVASVEAYPTLLSPPRCLSSVYDRELAMLIAICLTPSVIAPHPWPDPAH